MTAFLYQRSSIDMSPDYRLPLPGEPDASDFPQIHQRFATVVVKNGRHVPSGELMSKNGARLRLLIRRGQNARTARSIRDADDNTVSVVRHAGRGSDAALYLDLQALEGHRRPSGAG